jgi:hypothetical protein
VTVNLQVSDRVARQLRIFGPEAIDDIDRKLMRLLEAELRRQLARYDLTDRQLSRKYGMSYAEFENRQVTKQMGYSWEVESDAMAWETAIDGKDTVRRQLSELLHGDD